MASYACMMHAACSTCSVGCHVRCIRPISCHSHATAYNHATVLFTMPYITVHHHATNPFGGMRSVAFTLRVRYYKCVRCTLRIDGCMAACRTVCVARRREGLFACLFASLCVCLRVRLRAFPACLSQREYIRYAFAGSFSSCTHPHASACRQHPTLPHVLRHAALRLQRVVL